MRLPIVKLIGLIILQRGITSNTERLLADWNDF